MEIENNKDRAESAFRAMQTFSRLTEDNYVTIGYPCVGFSNLAADENAIDSQECLGRATRIYDAEVPQARIDEE